MRRREFVAGLGAAAWPAVARAQAAERVRRIGVLLFGSEGDSRQSYLAAIREGLKDLGWTDGGNLRIDIRSGHDSDDLGAAARELASLAPDVIVTSTGPAARAAKREIATIPIVFIAAGDPVATGLVRSIARPDGNITGVTNLFPSIGGKWLELLKEVAPSLTRVALLFDPIYSPDSGFFAPIEAAAAAYGITTVRFPDRRPEDIEQAITAIASTPNGGLIIVPPTPPETDSINDMAIRHRLPTIYAATRATAGGGLMSYGPDLIDLYRHGGPAYVDRILRGAKPGELPVQFPTKFELVINLKTAKTIGLTVPESILFRADKVIE